MSVKKLAIKEVAKRIGVSTASISYAFNRPEQLSEKKRKEILAECEKIGYYGPNRAAQSLRQGKSNIIALILPDELDYMISDPVASQFMEGVAKALKKADKHLLLFSGSNENVNEVIDFVDGFICYGLPRNSLLLKQISRIYKRLVTVDFDIENVPSVNITNEEAAYESACIAIKNCIANPAIIGLRLVADQTTCKIYNKPLIDSAYSISHRRLDGYLRAFKENNIAIDDNNIWHVPESTHEYAIIAAREILSSRTIPNVILCMSDVLALTVMKEALSRGIRIPEDLRVVGFDGIEQGQQYHPTLTTVQQFSVEKGKRAADIFLTQSSQSEILGFKILCGESA